MSPVLCGRLSSFPSTSRFLVSTFLAARHIPPSSRDTDPVVISIRDPFFCFPVRDTLDQILHNQFYQPHWRAVLPAAVRLMPLVGFPPFSVYHRSSCFPSSLHPLPPNMKFSLPEVFPWPPIRAPNLHHQSELLFDPAFSLIRSSAPDSHSFSPPLLFCQRYYECFCTSSSFLRNNRACCTLVCPSPSVSFFSQLCFLYSSLLQPPMRQCLPRWSLALSALTAFF